MGLFTSAFLAATILPAQSELGLGALLVLGEHSPFWLIFFASIGNILGAVVNWVLGRKFQQLKSKKDVSQFHPCAQILAQPVPIGW